MNCDRTILALLTGAALVLLGGVGAGAVEPLALDLSAEWQREFRTLEADLTNRVRFEKIAAQTHHPAALLDPADRDPLDIVLRRTEVLVADLRRSVDAAKIELLAEALAALQREAAGVGAF